MGPRKGLYEVDIACGECVGRREKCGNVVVEVGSGMSKGEYSM